MIRNKIKFSFYKILKRTLHSSKVAAKLESEKCEIEKIRNIGILAHIDAGKTTTTERMLYYSGVSKQIGEVHEGNTVTDFMDQERERGITICSAAVSFLWKKFLFHLIDTPGHIDFTMAVEQPLSVIDGVVVILDGSAGVEAQTITVWNQADRYNLPRIIYINKMDKSSASFEMCLKSIQSKLNTTVFPVHMPFNDETGFAGIVDIITLEKTIFDKKNQGKTIVKSQLSEETNTGLLDEALERRRYLIDVLSGFDNELANTIIEQESLDKISSQLLVDSLRRATISRKGIPVLLGSSYRNIGVQSLMNGIILYLPNPNFSQKTSLSKYFNQNLFAKVFKIIHDKHKGPVVFIRVYSGSLKKSQMIYNIRKQKSQQCGELYNVFADDYKVISEITEGNIGAMTGFKNIETGDILTNRALDVKTAKENMKEASIDTEDMEKLFSLDRNVPNPVFLCSIEPPSLMHIPALEIALEQLSKEDPSLRVSQNPETNQIILSGMGELHIDTIKERIRREYKIDVDLGKLQIAYKESIIESINDTYTIKHEINSVKQEVTVNLSLLPNHLSDEKLIVNNFCKTESKTHLLKDPKIWKIVKQGISTAFTRGPKLGFPVINTGVELFNLQVKYGTSDSMIIAAIIQGIRKLMGQSKSILLEPIMSVEVVTSNEKYEEITRDLHKRRATVKDVRTNNDNSVIYSEIPLSELLGYSNQLRKLSSGTATFSMQFSYYQEMNSIDEKNALREISGFS